MRWSPHDGVLKAQEEGTAGRLEPGEPVGDVDLNGNGYARLLHSQEMPEVVESGVLGHIDIFA